MYAKLICMIRVSAAFATAVEDYGYLLNRAYSVQRALELVGNHYQLDKEERLLLFRGIRPAPEVLALECRILPLPRAASSTNTITAWLPPYPDELQPEARLLIDGYNVLYTIISYLSGKSVFIANDGLARDIGAFHGRSMEKRHLHRAMELLAQACRECFPDFSVHVFLDAPISGSAEHKIMLETLFASCTSDTNASQFGAELLPSADYGLIHADSGILCTSDSVILSSSSLAVLDIARYILETTFRISLPHIQDFQTQ